MIKTFKKFILESFKSNPISIGNKTYYLETKFENDVLNVILYLNDLKYINLSVIVPETKNINKDEFFMNPKVDNKIITELEKQGFIQKLSQKTIAGENETNLYTII